ncbi:MAG: secretin N-terminal domain-containing protein [Sedimentisphaerales bacterium]
MSHKNKGTKSGIPILWTIIVCIITFTAAFAQTQPVDKQTDTEAQQRQNSSDPNETIRSRNTIAKQKSDFKSGSRPPSKSSEEITKKKLILPLAKNLVERVRNFFERKKALDYETISVMYVHVRELAANIGMIMNDGGVDFKRNISIQPIVRSKQLLVFGKKKYRDMVRKLVSEIDVPNNQLQRKTFTLKYAEPQDVKTKLNELFGDSSASQVSGKNTISAETVIITAYPSLKQIVVLASEEKMIKVVRLIRQWDEKQVNKHIILPPPDENNAELQFSETQLSRKLLKEIDTESFAKAEEYDIIPIDYVDVNEVVDSLDTVLKELKVDYTSKVKIVPVPEYKVLLIFGDNEFCKMVRQLIKPVGTSTNQLIRKTFQLRYADAKDVKEKLDELFGDSGTSEDGMDNTISADTVITIAYPSLKRIVVLASKEKMKELEKQIEEWDSPVVFEHIRARIYTLDYITPQDMVDLLTSLFSSTAGSIDDLNNSASLKESIIGQFQRKISCTLIPDTKKIIVVSETIEGYLLTQAIIDVIDSQEFIPFDKDKAYKKIRESLKTIEGSMQTQIR